MKLIRKYKFEILTFLVVSIVYFAARIPNLTLQPIFADEAIYVRWAQVMRAEPTLRFLPLSDGKTPLFMWTMIPLFKIFSDPLFAGRFLSVISGYFSLIGVLFLGWKFFGEQLTLSGKRVGFLAAALVAITPFMVFFDRMALVDSMLAAFSIWSLNLAIYLIKSPRLDVSMFLGYALGGGVLTKPPGFFNVLSLPLTLFLFNWKDKERQKNIIRIFGYWLIAIFISLVIYNVLRLGPGFVNLNSRNQDYVRSPGELLIRPWDPLLPHFRDLVGISLSFFGLPISLAIILGILMALIKRNSLSITILLWALFPLIVQMVILKTFTARYVLFSLPPLLTLAAWAILEIFNLKFFKLIYFRVALLIIIIAWPVYFLGTLLTNPESAPLFRNERRGYLEDWTAGYGLKDIAQFLDQKSKEGFVVVGTEGSFGTLPDGLQIYLDRNRQVAVVGGRATVSAQLRQASTEHPTYFVTNKSRYQILDREIELIKEYKKAVPTNSEFMQDAMLLFQVFPLKEASPSAKN